MGMSALDMSNTEGIAQMSLMKADTLRDVLEQKEVSPTSVGTGTGTAKTRAGSMSKTGTTVGLPLCAAFQPRRGGDLDKSAAMGVTVTEPLWLCLSHLALRAWRGHWCSLWGGPFVCCVHDACMAFQHFLRNNCLPHQPRNAVSPATQQPQCAHKQSKTTESMNAENCQGFN